MTELVLDNMKLIAGIGLGIGLFEVSMNQSINKSFIEICNLL